MKRPDLDTLACVNPECQRFRLTGQDNLPVHKVYGQDRIRLLRGRTCSEELPERLVQPCSTPKSRRNRRYPL